MPLVLLDGPFSSIWPAQIFLFFLTYGFVGLELVSIKLSDPFGKSRDDVPLESIREATILGIEKDMQEMATIRATISERRLRFSRQKKARRPPHPLEAAKEDVDGEHNSSAIYHAMGAGDINI